MSSMIDRIADTPTPDEIWREYLAAEGGDMAAAVRSIRLTLGDMRCRALSAALRLGIAAYNRQGNAP